jgi:hypothetical protein
VSNSVGSPKVPGKRSFRLLIACLFLALITVRAFPQASSTPPLTNEDVTKLVTSGLGSDVILTVIKGNPTAFDVSISGILSLKKAGVSESIISAMIEKSSRKEPEAPSPIRSPQAETIEYKRYETAPDRLTLATSFEVPAAWLKHDGENESEFYPENDSALLNGQSFFFHMIFFGSCCGADSPQMTAPDFTKNLQRAYPHIRLPKGWEYLKIPKYDGVAPEILVAEYETEDVPGHPEVGIVALQRAGVRYHWFFMGCPREDKDRFFPIYMHVLQSIRVTPPR